MTHEPRHSAPDPPPGDEFVRDLAALYGAGVEVPHDLDDAIRARLRAPSAPRRSRRLVATPWAAAAMLLIVASITVVLMMRTQPSRGPSRGLSRAATPSSAPSPAPPASVAVRPGDVDRNGRIDILDAFALARLIGDVASADALDRRLDLNGDGAVDARDVDAIALRAVSLSEEAS